MAQIGQTHESGRRETIDPTSGGGPKSAESGQHLVSYVGLAIAGMILLAMIYLQSVLATNL